MEKFVIDQMLYYKETYKGITRYYKRPLFSISNIEITKIEFDNEQPNGIEYNENH